MAASLFTSGSSLMFYVKRIGDHELPPPARSTAGAAGYDLRTTLPITLAPGCRMLVPTGFAWQLPTGVVGLIRPRSGSALHFGQHTLAGVIDSDYRGEVGVLLYNAGHDVIRAQPGDRIAQLLVVAHYDWPVEEIDTLDDSDRDGGFGSTGVA